MNRHMGFSERFERVFRKFLPSPFAIAVILTLISMLMAHFFMSATGGDQSHTQRFVSILDYWQKGVWESPLLVFALQMMLILVLGHILALSPPVDRFIRLFTGLCNTTPRAVFWISLLTLTVALFNWGLGLIFGAVFARKAGEHLSSQGVKFNYALLGAAGYSGLMVWHGGISGSAPIKASEEGHIREMMSGVFSGEQLAALPERISMAETVLSTHNLVLSAVLLVLIPLFLFILAHRVPEKLHSVSETRPPAKKKEREHFGGAEKIDLSPWGGIIFGAIVLLSCSLQIFSQSRGDIWGFLTPNYLNFAMLGLGLVMHRSFRNFLRALEKAIGGASGILIQFPLYFGIMGIMKYSGLVESMSMWFAENASGTTFPIFTFFSAALVNIFVPSGGGQWSLQGPIIVQAAEWLDMSLAKGIMSMAYGDQLTNMLQPFWALPLLGITGLKARDILPYTLLLMLLGMLIFLLAIWFY